jgi:hypothetical protein
VDPGFSVCPFCGAADAAAASRATAFTRRGAPARRRFTWGDVERGFRFGLGLVAALVVGYFVLFVAAYVADHPEWLDRLARWIRPR